MNVFVIYKNGQFMSMNFSTQAILWHTVLLCCRKNVLLSWPNILAFSFIWSFVLHEFTLPRLHFWLQICRPWETFFISFQITSCMIMWGKVALNTVKPFPPDLKITWVQYLKISLFCKIWKRDFGCSFGELKTERKDSLVFPLWKQLFSVFAFAQLNSHNRERERRKQEFEENL